MIQKMCAGCKKFFPRDSLYRNHCPDCAKTREAQRGSPRERGIGALHRGFAKLIKDQRLPCALCGQAYGSPGNPITVGHVQPRALCLRLGIDPDRRENLRAECRRCNYGRSNDARM